MYMIVCSTSDEKTEAHMELDCAGEACDSAAKDSPVYEMIGDANSSFNYTHNILYGLSTVNLTPNVPTGAETLAAHDRKAQVSANASHTPSLLCNPGSCDLSRCDGQEEISSYCDEVAALAGRPCDLCKVQECPAYGVPLHDTEQ
jgi:hypothetical protein